MTRTWIDYGRCRLLRKVQFASFKGRRGRGKEKRDYNVAGSDLSDGPRDSLASREFYLNSVVVFFSSQRLTTLIKRGPKLFMTLKS